MPAGAPWRSALARGVLFVTSDRAFLEQVLAQVLVGLGVAAAQPLQGHRRVLQLLAGVVQQDLAQFLVLAVVRALTVPVDGLELLDQRGDRVVLQQRLLLQFLAGDVQAFARHAAMLLVGSTNLARPVAQRGRRRQSASRR